MSTVKYQQMYNTLIAAQKVFVVSHPGCGDALGSSLAFGLWLKSIGIDYTMYSNDVIPESLEFLPHSHEIVTPPSGIHMADYDVILIVDANLHMTGIKQQIQEQIDTAETTVLNIDHHITNQGEGDISVIDTSASSTTFMLYQFFTANNIPITRDIATCLLVGILYDTGNFSNSATNNRAIQVAAELLATGTPLPMITQALVQNKKIPLLKLWGNILSRLEYNEDCDIVYTVIHGDDTNDGFEPSAGEIANFLNDVAEGSLSLILKQSDDGLVKASLRTTHDTVDVAKFAQYFGGGGHRKAAGFALPGRLVYNERTGKYRIV